MELQRRVAAFANAEAHHGVASPHQLAESRGRRSKDKGTVGGPTPTPAPGTTPLVAPTLTPALEVPDLDLDCEKDDW